MPRLSARQRRPPAAVTATFPTAGASPLNSTLCISYTSSRARMSLFLSPSIDTWITFQTRCLPLLSPRLTLQYLTREHLRVRSFAAGEGGIMWRRSTRSLFPSLLFLCSYAQGRSQPGGHLALRAAADNLPGAAIQIQGWPSSSSSPQTYIHTDGGRAQLLILYVPSFFTQCLLCVCVLLETALSCAAGAS
jgi:hypothetical protein